MAGLLSLLAVGLGDVYNGFPAKGLRLWLAATLAYAATLVAWTALLVREPSRGLVLAGGAALLAVAIGFPVASVTRSVADARRLRTAPRPRRRVLWCLAFLTGAWLVHDALASTVRSSAIQAFRIASGAMLPTLDPGDAILVDRRPRMREPRPGDVIVFLAPEKASPGDGQRRDFIKRVIAVAGQTIEVRNRQVLIDGTPWDDPHATFRGGAPDGAAPLPTGLAACGSVQSGTGYWCTPYTVPSGHVFVMGDNRDQSYDSRFWGPVALDDAKGRAVVVYWSWDGDAGRVRWERIGRPVE